MNSYLPKCCVLLVAVPLLGTMVPGVRADWPNFRGNALQNGIAESPLPAPLEVLWKIQAKDGIEATAAIVKGTVYFGSFDQYLYAVNLTDGKEKWKYKGGPFKAPPS